MTSVKRTGSEAGLELGGPNQRRRYHHHHALGRKQTIDNLSNPIPQDTESLTVQLQRAISMVLVAVGFHYAEPAALESMQLITQEYMSHLLSKVSQSMLYSRRTVPIPSDFLTALNAHNLTLSSLLPHLDPPVDKELTQPSLSIEVDSKDAQIAEETAQISLFLKGPAPAPAYITSGLPSLPSTHTYKSEAVYTQRESDPKVVRERATEEGRLGEEALRRLVSSRSKAENSMDAKRKTGSIKQRGRELWRQTMAKVMEAEGDGSSSAEDFDEYSIRVNADSIYWRKPASGLGDGV